MALQLLCHVLGRKPPRLSGSRVWPVGVCTTVDLVSGLTGDVANRCAHDVGGLDVKVK
jgi:hypothetical protein